MSIFVYFVHFAIPYKTRGFVVQACFSCLVQSFYSEMEKPYICPSKNVKLYHIVDLKTLAVAYQTYHPNLPPCYKKGMLKIKKMRTVKKWRCVSIQGVSLWNNLGDNLKILTCFINYFYIIYYFRKISSTRRIKLLPVALI